MQRWPSLLFAMGITCFPAVATACLCPPPSPRKSGESDTEYRRRSEQELREYLSEQARRTEASYYREAESIYFARIVRSEEIRVDGTPLARRVVLKAVHSVKGSLPNRRITIKDREWTSCGIGGDGPATSGSVGQVAIVFQGVSNEGAKYRSRLYAVLAESTQEPHLLDAWSRWKAHPDGDLPDRRRSALLHNRPRRWACSLLLGADMLPLAKLE